MAIVLQAFRKHRDGYTSLDADALYSEFRAKMAFPDQYRLWNLSNHGIRPPLLLRLLDVMQNDLLELSVNFAIDLDANRLDTMCTEDFRSFLSIIIPAERLTVRFGFEIFVPHLYQAAIAMGSEQIIGQRIIINTPWQTDRVTELTEQLAASNFRLEKRNLEMEKILQRCEKRCLEIEKRNPVLQLQQFKNYMHIDAVLIEEHVTQGVADILEDSDIIHESRYTYSGHSGDLDGLVLGRFQDKPVVVLIEAKHNMSNQVTKARSELFSSENYIRELRNLDYDAADVDSDMFADYRALRIDEYRDHEIMYAFGGLVFSDEAAARLALIRTAWFRVVPDTTTKRFVATLWGT